MASLIAWHFIPPIAGLFMGALPSRHHDCGFKVSCTSFLYTSTLKPLPAYQLSKAADDLFMGAMARVWGRCAAHWFVRIAKPDGFLFVDPRCATTDVVLLRKGCI